MTDLDTAAIQTGILINEVINLWKRNEPLPTEISTDFIYRILDLKLQWAGLRHIIPDYLIVIVSMLAGGNPGASQIMLKEILMHSRKSVSEHYREDKLIPASVFVSWYLNQPYIPILLNPEVSQKYDRVWLEQKLPDGANGVDTQEYWQELKVESLDKARLPYNKRWENRHRAKG